MSRQAELVEALASRGLTIAAAESLTGGLVSAAIVDVPGASRAMRGGIVAYDTRAKRELLGVDGELLAARGAVDPLVAEQMARGVRRAFILDGSVTDVGLATTGVAGPDPQDGQPVGTVYVAVAVGDDVAVERCAFEGDRASIRAAAVDAVLGLALRELGNNSR
ncbi:CinA family protein [Microbacterium sorbitolivorans]|uniref:CinA family protein n=1 Tax=Microbacterium sorbitolivorans TaxID=1867410 RepID=A0A367XZW8_9MICO|nr:CinA family protein [Microbacterium sorbitolivorans]RCK58352.1 CinA family protein [Microbacterium sorbitolivorans]